jgi:hypothetical protein
MAITGSFEGAPVVETLHETSPGKRIAGCVDPDANAIIDEAAVEQEVFFVVWD